MSDLLKYLESGKYLPDQMRDFHDQKNLFKSMHLLFQDEDQTDMPNWVNGHIYTIDWFLWFMASRGYNLQKSRKKNIEFKDWPNFKELLKEENSK